MKKLLSKLLHFIAKYYEEKHKRNLDNIAILDDMIKSVLKCDELLRESADLTRENQRLKEEQKELIKELTQECRNHMPN